MQLLAIYLSNGRVFAFKKLLVVDFDANKITGMVDFHSYLLHSEITNLLNFTDCELFVYRSVHTCAQ